MNQKLQSLFYKFHDAIKLDRDDINPVIEKRNDLIGKIRTYLNNQFEQGYFASKITFDKRDQGSYAMFTGIKPLNNTDDYDIDVALIFNIAKDDYTPKVVKQWIYDALNNSFVSVEIKKPCVRVQYHEDGFPKFHIDFACFSNKENNTDEKCYFAMGKKGMKSHEVEWQLADPGDLVVTINTRFPNKEEQSQLRRVIRYLKRWKDIEYQNVSNDNEKLTGIAITCLAYYGFKPSVSDNVNDLEALRNLVEYITNQFNKEDIISTNLPIAQPNNLFGKMSLQGMKNLKKKLEYLLNGLNSALTDIDNYTASQNLAIHFGSDFPTEPKSETATSQKTAGFSNSSSAA